MRKVYPACEVIARYVLPVFRSLVAKELIEKYNFTQVAAAEKLGTTQAAISQYICSKRGYKGIEQFRDVLPEIQSTASETAKRIAIERMGKEEVMSGFCRLCMLLREKGKLSTSKYR
ncbi:MAG: transcriptional regulator [Candidatus Bathyarchaeota archaeon]|nr:transcriptional regulator [Candidatus Bathyarchaeota archaeon]